jgi:phenylalanyl-tRNA synthetase beta chain
VKLSLNWLKEYVVLPKDLTAEQIQYDLTMSTVEVEKVIDLSKTLEKVCTGIIKEVKKHPDADRLRVVLTDLGQYGIKDIVCGGSNLVVGQTVAVALPGAMVLWHGEGDLVEVKETKIRGQASFGMICASEEIGLSGLFPAKDDKEIIDLTFYAKEAGVDLSKIVGFDDFILEIDNKSLSNRPDLWSHYGIARELSAIYNCKLNPLSLPKIDFESDNQEISIDISDSENCYRYSGLVIEGVNNNEPSPLWLKAKLAKAGQRSISLLVDLTNFVMLSVGQPTHVFDYEKISNSKIIVRKSKESEKLKLLDDSEITFDADSLVIADSTKALALAGVMGGKESGVTEGTNKIIFESANFNSVKIRKAVAKYNIRTESSMRFEKGQAPYNTEVAASLFLTTLKEIQKSVKLITAVDKATKKIEKITISIDHEFVRTRLGDTCDNNFITNKLTALGFKVEENKNGFEVEVPQFRATGDVSIKEDLIEEIARMIGYDNLRYSPIKVDLNKAVQQTSYKIEKQTREFLAQAGGLTEVVNYPWVNLSALNACGAKASDLLSLLESPGTDCNQIRNTLVPGMLDTIARNINNFENFGIFELGTVFFNDTKPFSEKSSDELLPRQQKNLALALVGKKEEELFPELKEIIIQLCRKFNFSVDFTICDNFWLKNIGALNIIINNEALGTIFIPTNKTLQTLGIKYGKAVIAEINFSVFRNFKITNCAFKELPKFQVVNFDLAVVFDKDVTWKDIQACVLKSDNLIDQVNFMDQYQGEQVPEGKKSIAFTMEIVPREKTLTAEEINQITKNVLKNLSDKLNGQLRS